MLPVRTAVSRVNFLFSFFHKKDISWVIIRIEIKMSCLISFKRCQSSCEEHGTSEHYKKNIVLGRIRSTNTAHGLQITSPPLSPLDHNWLDMRWNKMSMKFINIRIYDLWKTRKVACVYRINNLSISAL